MRIYREDGNILLGLIVILALGIFILLSISNVIHRYLQQERVLLQTLSENRMMKKEFQLLFDEKGLLDALEWEVVAGEEGCRLFGEEEAFLAKDTGWYGRKLSGECLTGVLREIVGVYHVEKNPMVDIVRYSYAARELPFKSIPRVFKSSVRAIGEGVEIEVFYNNEVYQYIVYTDTLVEKVFVLQSVVSDGFLLIINNELWALPINQDKPYKVIDDLSLRNGVLLADLMDEYGLYLMMLKRIGSRGESEIYIDFYENTEKEFITPYYKELVALSLELDSYSVLHVDDRQSFVEIVSQGVPYLLAVKWDGGSVWGGRYLWGKKAEGDCPLQAESFEPILGWVLGCQRMPVTKIGIK